MSTQYKQLLKLRRQRELRKTLQANQKREEVRAAEAEEQAARDNLDASVEERTHRQQEIYSANTGIETDRRGIEKNAAEIQRLKEKQRAKEQLLVQAENETAVQNEAWMSARQERIKESRGVKKFENLTQRVDETDRKQKMRDEELKNEEIQTSKDTNSG